MSEKSDTPNAETRAAMSEARQMAQATDFRVFLTQAQSRLGFEDDEMARRCHVSLSTIKRWKHGETSPHPSSLQFIKAALS